VSGRVVCKVSQNSRIVRWYSGALPSWYRFNWKIPEAQDRVTREGATAIWNEIVQNPSEHSPPPPPSILHSPFSILAGAAAVRRRRQRSVRSWSGRCRSPATSSPSSPPSPTSAARAAAAAAAPPRCPPPIIIPTIFRIRIRNPESNSEFEPVCVSRVPCPSLSFDGMSFDGVCGESSRADGVLLAASCAVSSSFL